MSSPYENCQVDEWESKTYELINAFPVPTDEIIAIVLESWNAIFDSRIGGLGYRIGRDIYPQPQIMGFFLHELIPLELENRYPNTWARDVTGYGKDAVCITNSFFSCEIKTSSDKLHIFGNRSHAQVGNVSKKDKSGYYLAVNFGKFVRTADEVLPAINRIRLGWLDSTDWQGQVSATGQQARLSTQVEKYKLIELYRHK